MSTQPAAISTVEHAGFTITGTGASTEALSAPPETQDKAEGASPKETLSKAASELGKEGAKAAAKARKEAAKAAPAEEAPEAKPEAKPAEKPEAKAAPAEEAEEEGETPEERKSRAQQRVQEATRAAAEAKRELAREKQEREALARRLEALERERTRPEAAPAEKPAPPKSEAASTDDPRPKPDDFENWSDYEDKLLEWNRREFRREMAKEQEAERHVQEVGRKADAFFGRLKSAAQADPEFHGRTIEFVGNLQPSWMLRDGQARQAHNDIADELFRSESAPALISHFVEHPEDFDRLRALRSSREVLREMVKIEARLEGATAGTPPSSERPASKPEVSKAPPPVRPVTGAPIAAGGPALRPGEDFDAWLARQRKR